MFRCQILGVNLLLSAVGCLLPFLLCYQYLDAIVSIHGNKAELYYSEHVINAHTISITSIDALLIHYESHPGGYNEHTNSIS